MSLLIKALQKAEQSKDAKASNKPASATGLSLELTPQDPKPEPAQAPLASKPDMSATENSGLSLSQIETTIAAPPNHEPSLADEAGFSEPLTPISVEPPKVNPAKTDPLPTESAKATKPAETLISGKPAGSTPQSSTKVSPAPAATQRQAAASLLSLQPDEKKRVSTTSQRSLLLGGGALLLLLVGGGGFYYYLQTMEQPQLLAVPPPIPQPAQPQPAPMTATVPPAPVVDSQENGAKAELPTIKPEAKKEITPQTEKSATPVDSGVVVTQPTVPAPRPVKAPRATSAGDSSPMQVARLRKGEPAVNATHVAAYQAFTNGDDATAGKLYKQLLQAEPRNVDALLGLAAVAARQEHLDEATSLYQRALELDPRNGIAQAGLITLLGQANPTEAESRLKSLIAQQPEAAYLHAALGGVYADQNQWPNAQQSYFQAFRLDSGSADYAFNLAISLDQLHKADLALDYYLRALDLLPKQPGAVDKEALEARISQLRSALGK